MLSSWHMNILHISLLFRITNGYHAVFCPDLVPRKLTLESIGEQLALLGTTWDTVEQLTTRQVQLHFIPVYADYCLERLKPTKKCVREARETFLRYMRKFIKLTTNERNRLDDPLFVIYETKRRTDWSALTQKLFLASCVTTCSSLLHSPGKRRLFKAACVDPCDSQTSCPPSQCQRLGLFAHEYRCQCGGDLVWNEQVHTCLSRPLDDLRSGKKLQIQALGVRSCLGNTYCEKEGTLYCQEDIENQRTFCLCKPHRQGLQCKEVVDACKQRIEHPYLPNGGHLEAGEWACNINDGGNRCDSFITPEGYPMYKCNCNAKGWDPDHRLPYDNCRKYHSTCEAMLCIRGRCVTNDLGEMPYCSCELGYSGIACDEWTGDWSEWTPWDKCRPACGVVRYSVRSRDCRSMQTESGDIRRDCVGAPIEYWKCDVHPCAHGEGTFLSTYFATRQHAIASGISAAAVLCGLFTVLWFLLLRSTLSEPMRTLVDICTKRFKQKYPRRQRAVSIYPVH